MKILRGCYGVGSLIYKLTSYRFITKKASKGSEFLPKEIRDKLFVSFASDLLKNFNVRDHCKSLPKIDRPSLVVGNHISYLDMPLVAKYCPATFVAKEEVNSWPIFGKFNKQMRTISLKRSDKSSRSKAAEQIAASLRKQKDSVILFPSGTTSIEKSIMWKRGSFQIAEKYGIPIVPFRLQYSPLRRAAFIGKDLLLPHIYRLSYHGPLDAYIEFADPLIITNAEKQLKEVQAWCQEPFVSKEAYDSLVGGKESFQLN